MSSVQGRAGVGETDNYLSSCGLRIPSRLVNGQSLENGFIAKAIKPNLNMQIKSLDFETGRTLLQQHDLV